jgi:hypothetical protein
LVAAVAIAILLQPDSNNDGSTNASRDPAPVEATFAPVREGAFMVQRNWEVEGDTLRASAILRPVSPGTGGIHRQAIDPSRTGPPTIDAPQPDTYDDAASTATYFDVSLREGEALQLAYVVSLPGSLGKADIHELYRQWLPLREQAVPAIDARDPVPAPSVSA